MTGHPPQTIATMPSNAAATTLKRRLGLPLLVLYGTGITIGAGIYVLIGAVAGHAGVYAPWSFLLAAAIMALTVASYIELSSRFPVSAGEAAYVKAAFESRPLAIWVGVLTIGIATVSSAAVALGSAGYIQQFLDWPKELIVIALVLLLGAVAAWGILESVVLASLFTLIEVGGLVAIIAFAVYSNIPIAASLTNIPPLEATALSGIAFGSLLAFFAFIGFEDLANVVEEAKEPHRNIPRAMVLTLLISTALYVLVAAVAVSTVSIERLALSPAPLSLVFHAVAAINPRMISVIAIVATMNTILAQMTMAARVIYGLARDGDLPPVLAVLAKVHPVTGTPVMATALIVSCVIPLALSVRFAWLAEGTSLATLVVFALVNASLLKLRYRRALSPYPHVNVPIWVPALGVVACIAMIASSLL
jgi:APA family basic amino acid/polyamine antiporter